jgi:hypothetical protein
VEVLPVACRRHRHARFGNPGPPPLLLLVVGHAPGHVVDDTRRHQRARRLRLDIDAQNRLAQPERPVPLCLEAEQLCQHPRRRLQLAQRHRDRVETHRPTRSRQAQPVRIGDRARIA